MANCSRPTTRGILFAYWSLCGIRCRRRHCHGYCRRCSRCCRCFCYVYPIHSLPTRYLGEIQFSFLFSLYFRFCVLSLIAPVFTVYWYISSIFFGQIVCTLFCLTVAGDRLGVYDGTVAYQEVHSRRSESIV